MKCYFCNNDVETREPDDGKFHKCQICGELFFEDADGFPVKIHEGTFSEDDKSILRIVLRNQYEKTFRPIRISYAESLKKNIEQYRPMTPLEKLDHALQLLEKRTQYVGQRLNVPTDKDYPVFHCVNQDELFRMMQLLCAEGYIDAKEKVNPHIDGYITARGYKRLQELQQAIDSRQCFVAMWFGSDMDEVFEKAIQPGIEFMETGETEPRFRALRIDNKEHTNDINDEMISEIRRSRFIVCDLTGYRGGVYFEAGFAYGLGKEVIYTCRKDWTQKDTLKNSEGEEVQTLYDSAKNEINICKEGVHFDLQHRNRIEWSPDNYEEFKTKLTNRIKAVIM
ncbi:hypothetical protein ACFL43_01785 [Thermodesulfobacteriota bacterium]